MNTMLTYNTNSKTGPVCGGRASDEKTFIFIMNSEATTDLWYINNIE